MAELTPADLIRRAAAVGRSRPVNARKPMTNGEARQHATDTLVAVCASVLGRVNPDEIVEANEKLAHLSPFERTVVAQLIDRAWVTFDVDFDHEDDDDYESGEE